MILKKKFKLKNIFLSEVITRVNQNIYNILVHVSLWQFKPGKVPSMVGITIDGALTCFAWFHSKCDLKVTQMNAQHSLIMKVVL